MSPKKLEFKGKDVAEAIRNACDSLKASQEDLDIEVLHTGSAGIFGLCRRKAVLRVSLKQRKESEGRKGRPRPEGKKTEHPPQPPPPVKEQKEPPAKEPPAPKPRQPQAPAAADASGPGKEESRPRPPAVTRDEAPVQRPAAPRPQAVAELSETTATAVRENLERLLALMACPSEVSADISDNSLLLHVRGEHLDTVIGPDGKTLDGIQYLLRKIVGKQFSEKIQVTLDAGDFRESRTEELETLSRQYAAEVIETGKTRSIAGLNPAERRIVHLNLQKIPEVRSRSVGDGLLKKVLIFKPGKGKKPGGGRRRQGPRPPKTKE